MQIDKKRITTLGICIVVMSFLAKKDRREELRYWLEYQANRLSVLKKHAQDF